MNDHAAIIAAESRADRAESAALSAEIQLAITRTRLAELEATAAMRRDAVATAAVMALVRLGTVRRDDFTMQVWKQKFLNDAALITLAVGKTFNMRKRATK